MADALPHIVDLDPRASEEAADRDPEAGVSLAKRLRDPKTLLSFVVAILLLVTVFRKLGDLSSACVVWRRAGRIR